MGVMTWSEIDALVYSSLFTATLFVMFA